MHYHDSEDLKRLGEFKQLAPTEFSAFVEFDKIVGRESGAIPRKYRELIAIGLACTTQCPYCLDVHTRAAARAGALAPSSRCHGNCSDSRSFALTFDDFVLRMSAGKSLGFWTGAGDKS